MFELKEIALKFFRNKTLIFLYFFLVNLPLLICTFNTTNWSDDYQQINLFTVKAKFSPLLPMLFEPTGGRGQSGHFAPIYGLIKYLFTLFTLCPKIFHLQVVFIYILTALIIYLIVVEYFKDKWLGILSGTLFSINYYTAFLGLNWNCMHAHVTNTFTGACSIFLLFRYINLKKIRYLFLSLILLLLTIFNLENGFVFLPMLFVISFLALIKKEINFKKFFIIILSLLIVAGLYPVGAYFSTGSSFPLSYRFDTEYKFRDPRNLQGYAFMANNLFINSLGFSILYNKLIFDKLSENKELKEKVKKIIRENDPSVLKNLPLKTTSIFLALGIFTVLIFIFILTTVLNQIREQTFLFLVLYGLLFFIYLFIFYRIDIVNAISICSSIVIADSIISFLRDKQRYFKQIGIGIIGLYCFLTVWTITDQFDDCYRKSFYGLSKVAIQGPDKIYNEINKEIGRYAQNGIILFIHDYSPYHQTTGFERIGDTIDIQDLASYNATIFYKELLDSDLVKEYKRKTMREFVKKIVLKEHNKQIIVSTREEAINYLNQNKIDTEKVEAIYLSKNYDVIKLSDVY